MIRKRKIHPSNSSKSWSDPWVYSLAWSDDFACSVTWSGRTYGSQWTKNWSLGWFLNRSWREPS